MAEDKISVQLLTRLAGIGKEGEIVLVSRTQAKNYLIPKGFARLADAALIKNEAEKLKKKQDAHSRLMESRHEIAAKLHTQVIEFELAGSGDKIFGGVGEKDIIERIKKAYGIELEKKNISLDDGHLKKVGDHNLRIVHLGEDTFIRMTVRISVKSK